MTVADYFTLYWSQQNALVKDKYMTKHAWEHPSKQVVKCHSTCKSWNNYCYHQ